MNVDQGIVGAAFTVLGYFALRFLKDLKGLSRKINKVLAVMFEWDGLTEKERRAELSAILKGK